jgi:hypothetical protein
VPDPDPVTERLACAAESVPDPEAVAERLADSDAVYDAVVVFACNVRDTVAVADSVPVAVAVSERLVVCEPVVLAVDVADPDAESVRVPEPEIESVVERLVPDSVCDPDSIAVRLRETSADLVCCWVRDLASGIVEFVGVAVAVSERLVVFERVEHPFWGLR